MAQGIAPCLFYKYASDRRIRWHTGDPMAAAHRSRTADKRAPALEPTTIPVFVDPSGRRRRWVRRGALAVGTLLVGYLGLVSIAATGRPDLLPILVPGAATQRHPPAHTDVPHERLTVPTVTTAARPSTTAHDGRIDSTRSVVPSVATSDPSRLPPTSTPRRTFGPTAEPRPSHRPVAPPGRSHSHKPHPPHPSKPSTGHSR